MDRLDERETALYDALTDEGYDMATFYKEHGYINLTDDMTPAQREAVDVLLEQVRPTKRKIGEVTVTVPLGATGYRHTVHESEEDLSRVDVLDESVDPDDNDAPTDFECVYRADNDAKPGESRAVGGLAEDDADEPDAFHCSGADWLEGCRMSAELMGQLKPHQLEAVSLAIRSLNANEGALIAHAMGLGKTFTILTVLHLTITPTRAHAILLCPKAVVH